MKSLLKPFKLGSLELANRIVMAPMTRNMSKEHVPGSDVAQYYKRRAEGGVGLIITEGTVIGHKAANAYPNVPNFYGDNALEAWRHIVNEVHQAGGKIFPKLWHVGSVRQMHRTHNQGVDNPQALCCYEENVPGYAPSPVSHPYVEDAEVPHEMTHQDIADVVACFAKAATDAKELGFDGIEIHGAHGYLIDQFFWEYTNKRNDEYGGRILADRTRFAVEIIQAVREAVGQSFPIDFRFSQWKMGDYAARLAKTPEELESFLLPLKNAGVDIFHCSTRRFWEPEFPGSTLNLAGWTRKITGNPTITVGSVGLDLDFISTFTQHANPHQTQSRMHGLITSLEREEFDLVAVGRALLADPYWLQKNVDGRIDDITPFSKEQLSRLY